MSSRKSEGPAGESCERCRYWQEATEKEDPARWGWCFLSPPTVLGIDDEGEVIVGTSWTALPRFCANFAPRVND